MGTSSLKWEFSAIAARRLLLLDETFEVVYVGAIEQPDIGQPAVTIKSLRLGITEMHAPDLTAGMDALVTIYLARKDPTS